MTEKRFLLDKVGKGNAILSVKITDSVSDYDYFIMTKEVYEDDIDEIVDLLNEQQATIEMYQRRVHKREEQISIIKKHCLKFLNDEQFETIRKELDDE